MLTAAPAHPGLGYRRDIDGLRAVAVLAVVAFHAFPGHMPGGFIGVDVFFVISGYLITSILVGELRSGTFNPATFYVRRVRRIFPALLVMLAACLGFGWYALLADEFAQVGTHVVAGAAFVVNVVLARETNYFDTAAETKPLLHLWSLGIEEQFYIAWPLILWALWRVGKHLRVVTLTLAVLSLAASVFDVGLGILPFYSPFTRAWELLVGGLLAMRLRPDIHAERVGATPGQHATSILGLAAILAALGGLDRSVAYPGAWALLPVLGSAALIAVPPAAIVNRVVLSHAAMVWVGLLSYPWYLWHWPLLSFARITQTQVPSRSLRVSAVVISLLLAWLTVRFVEQPIRAGARGRHWVPRLAIAMVAMATFGAWVSLSAGVPWRSVAQQMTMKGDRGHLEFHRYPAARWHRCTPEWIAAEALTWSGYLRCLQSQPGEQVDMVLLGDSHAEQLFVGLSEQLPQRNIAFYIQAAPPFLEHPWFARVYAHVLAQPSIRTVVVTRYWQMPAPFVPPGSSVQDEVLRTVRGLLDAGKDVYITDDVPTFAFSPDRCQGARRLGPPRECAMPRATVDMQLVEVDRMLRAVVSSEPRLHLLRTRESLCDGRECAMASGDELLYRDDNHLNLNGSRVVAKYIIERAPSLQR